MGFLDLRNNWSLSQRRDKGQNDLRQRRGQMTFNLDHTRTNLGGWTIGLEGKFHRISQVSQIRDIVDNGSDLGLAAGTKLFERAVHAIFPPMRDFSVESKANFGYSDQTGVNRRSAGQQVLLDTTRVGGVFRRYEFSLNGTVRGVSVQTSMGAEDRSGDSETIQRDAGTDSLLRRVKDETRDRDRSYDGRLGWSPKPEVKANLRARKSDRRTEYWDAAAEGAQGALETRMDKEESGSLQIEWTPTRTSVFKGDLGLGDYLTDYRLQVKRQGILKKRGSFDGRVALPSLAGPLAGTELQAQYSYDEARNELEESSDHRQGNRKLRFQVIRGLGTKLKVQFTQEMGLQQLFFSDGSQDRDERRLFTDGVLTYVPSGSFNGLFNVNFGERRSVNIPAAMAGNNSTTETYKVTADVGYTRGRLNLTQRYTVNADYVAYDFNESNNSLTRSNEVLTNLRTVLGTALGLSLSHSYRHRNSGKYVRERPSEPRRYAQSTSEIHHALTLGTRYSIGSDFSIDGQQLFDQRQSKSGSRVTTTRRVEFSLSASFVREFSDTFRIEVRFKKTESNQEKDYWSGLAKLDKAF